MVYTTVGIHLTHTHDAKITASVEVTDRGPYTVIHIGEHYLTLTADQVHRLQAVLNTAILEMIAHEIRNEGRQA